MRKKARPHWRSSGFLLVIPLLALILACGPGEQPAPTPTAAPTATAAPAATPTPTRPGPTATPTPTTVVPPTPTPGEQPKRGGRLLILSTYYWPDYDIQVTGGNQATTPLTWIHNNLFINTEGEKIECEICAPNGWRLEDGGKTMVFDMVQGIKFHNGQEMTSADVAYNVKKIMGQIDGILSPRMGVIKEYITSIETPSRYQLKIHMVRPSVFVPKVLGYSWGGLYPEGTTRAMLKEKPYGSGPFLLTETVTGASYKMDRNPNYFKPSLPYLDGADYVIVGDATTRNAAFLTRKVQITSLLQPQYMAQLERLVAEGKMNSGISLGGCGPHFVGWVNFKPPFNDIKVRKAVNLAIDRKALGEITYSKWAVPQLMFYGKGQDYATPEEKIWNVVPGWGTGAKKQQEIEEAKKLLTEAGYANGFDLVQAARTPFSDFGFTAGHEPVQQMLGKIGIRTTLKPVDTTTHAIMMTNLDYQIQFYLFCQPSRDPDEVIGGYWITGASRGWFGYSNPEIDKLFIQMSGELDPQKRKELFLKIQDIIVVQTVGYAPTPRADNYVWWWKSLKGVKLGLDGIAQSSSGFLRYDKLWIDS